MRAQLLLVAALTACGVGLVAPSPASADCAGPYGITTADAALTASRAEPLVVTGSLFVDGSFCDDQPSGCSNRSRKGTPSEDVVLRLTQGTRTYDLGTQDADDRGAITWNVRIPSEVRPGPVVLTTSKSDFPVRLTLT